MLFISFISNLQHSIFLLRSRNYSGTENRKTETLCMFWLSELLSLLGVKGFIWTEWRVARSAGRGCRAPPRMFFVRDCGPVTPPQSSVLTVTLHTAAFSHPGLRTPGWIWRENIWRQKYKLLLPVELRLFPSLRTKRCVRVLLVREPSEARDSDATADI